MRILNAQSNAQSGRHGLFTRLERVIILRSGGMKRNLQDALGGCKTDEAGDYTFAVRSAFGGFNPVQCS